MQINSEQNDQHLRNIANALLVALRVIFCILILLLGMLIQFLFGEKKTVQERVYLKEINSGDIPEINKYVKNINSGGCGFFALKLYNRLDSCYYEIVAINGLNHIAIREISNGAIIDCNGYQDVLSMQLRYKNKIEPISKDSLERLVYDFGKWNKAFTKIDTAAINLFIDRL